MRGTLVKIDVPRNTQLHVALLALSEIWNSVNILMCLTNMRLSFMAGD